MAQGNEIGLKDRLQDVAIRAVLRSALLIPYSARVRVVGWIVATLVAPLAGWRRRIRDNLALALPDLPKAEVERIVRKVPDNVGRALIEIYSGEEFVAHAKDSPLEGPGVDALLAAGQAKTPIILVTAHMGNYDAVRGKLQRNGYAMGALYKPMANKAFNAHYLAAISVIGEPLFPTTGAGIGALVRHLKDGGIIGIVADVASRKAPILRFFGRPAHTPLSAAEWAVKYDAALIPIFGLRQDDGLTFRLHVAEPISHGSPEEMMQTYNDTVERIVRDNVDQWFWIHRRWKRARGAVPDQRA